MERNNFGGWTQIVFRNSASLTLTLCLMMMVTSCEEVETEWESVLDLESKEQAMGLDWEYHWAIQDEFTENKGHNWINKKAVAWLERQNRLPEGVDEYMMDYGSYYADYPFVGPPHLKNRRPPGPMDELLSGKVVASNTNTEGVWPWSCKFEGALKWSDRNSNLHLTASMKWSGNMCTSGEIEPRPVENASHFANRKDAEVSYGGKSFKGWRANVHADHYAARLYKIGRRFWKSNAEYKYWPSLGDLECVDEPGKVFLYNDDASMKAPPTCLGGAPFILTEDGDPTWPLWINWEPDDYTPEKLTQWYMPPSDQTGNIYLGWTLHLLQDLYVPYHALDISGEDEHQPAERDLDELIDTGHFDHLPVFSASGFRYAKNYGMEPLHTDEFFWMIFLPKRDFCTAILRGEVLEERFKKALETSEKHVSSIAPEASWEKKRLTGNS